MDGGHRALRRHAVHYMCDEENNWWPDMADVEAKITERTRAIVLINPNNPTGAVYPRHILEGFADLARRHDLVLFSDEIYEKITFEDKVHIHTASVARDIPVLTFSGLSKAYRMPGYRAGWVAVCGRAGPPPHTGNPWNCSPRSGSAPMFPRSTRSRRRWAATKASRT